MQVSNAIITVAAEVNLVLIIGGVFLFLHWRKLKSLVRRQQERILELLQTQPNSAPAESGAITSDLTPTQNYKLYLNKEIEATESQFSLVAPGIDIGAELPSDLSMFERILALRYAFLRAEEIGTTEDTGTTEYWSIFQQALEPLLQKDNQELTAELDTAKKRIENLEKFKRLFFDMEKQWNNAQANAQDYYAQLMEMSEGVADREGFNETLQRYHGVYDDIHQHIIHVNQNPDAASEHRTINITRQDPRAAEEIMKLRNVAADQHRIINQLQRKLIDAKTTEEKELVIQELQQQLQRQTRFVQESETCVQLLEDELSKAQEELSLKEKALDENAALDEENQKIKSTLQSFTLESKDMMSSISELEKENDSLKQNLRQVGGNAPTSSANQTTNVGDDVKKIQAEFMDLKKQYAELEERYLDLKLSGK